MSDFICPQTGLECPTNGLCERYTEAAREAIVENRIIAAEFREKWVESGIVEIPGLDAIIHVETVRADDNGVLVHTSGEEARAIREAQSPSTDLTVDVTELNTHIGIRRMLPFPADSESPDKPHDEYDQLSQTVCLRGTAAEVTAILETPLEDRERIIAELLIACKRAGFFDNDPDH